MAESKGELLHNGQDHLSQDRLSSLYFDPDLRAAAARLTFVWGDRQIRDNSEANYLAEAASRGLSPEEAWDILPILNSGRSPV